MQRSESFFGRTAFNVTLFVCGLLLVQTARADDGYRLWLRYEPLPAGSLDVYRQHLKSISVQGKSPTFEVIRNELRAASTGLLGAAMDLGVVGDSDDASVVVGLPETSTLVRKQHWEAELRQLGPDGYRIRTLRVGPRNTIVITATTDVGALYGTFHFLRLLQTRQRLDRLQLDESPRLRLRILNHWDNLDGSIERGYAGKSLWNWAELPERIDVRLTDYARANASIGINGAVLNNVNANAQILTAEYLAKVAAIANVFRPYGIRVYLSARFSAPIELGGMKTADPLDPSVIAWWRKKAGEIYKVIPDFGGFLVKANSEGQPGPRTYGRTHVDGANMLAAAVAPHDGIVMWRAFVYDMKPGYDRAGAAYENLQPFDGKFAANVLLQVKNGPIDFQPREPFHPLFGGMPRTPVMPELQITQEYLGFANHFAFLATMWREFLDSDTYARGPGSTVSRVVARELHRQIHRHPSRTGIPACPSAKTGPFKLDRQECLSYQRLTGIAGVANTGSDRNWSGHHLLQANWYAFGRLAWNPRISSREIAQEWTRMTLTHDPPAVATIVRLMLESHEAVVNYMTPLGLHHLFWGGHHYGPAPWWDTEKRDDWNPVYYHKADAFGIGFDRTKTGSNTVSQYHAPVRQQFSNLDRCPEKFLLWFHHVSWERKMKSGRTLWDELALHYQDGVNWTRATRASWTGLTEAIDPERHAGIAQKLAIQERDAVWWRDACLLYFQTFAKRPLPRGVEQPGRPLADYKARALEW